MGTQSGSAEIRSRRLYSGIALGATCLLLLLSFRILVGELYYSGAMRVLDDKATEHRDIAALSERSLPAYSHAQQLLARAVRAAPWKASYVKALAEMSMRGDAWVETRKTFVRDLPAFESPAWARMDIAEKYFLQAIAIEPTNADHHLALAQLCRDRHGNAGSMERALQLAGRAAPMNSAVLHAIAVQYLLTRQQAKALKHAMHLAAVDDSYIIYDVLLLETLRGQKIMEYNSFLSRSYLFQALEIAWRASERDREAVRQIVPDEPQAKEVEQLFWDAKGLGG